MCCEKNRPFICSASLFFTVYFGENIDGELDAFLFRFLQLWWESGRFDLRDGTDDSSLIRGVGLCTCSSFVIRSIIRGVTSATTVGSSPSFLSFIAIFSARIQPVDGQWVIYSGKNLVRTVIRHDRICCLQLLSTCSQLLDIPKFAAHRPSSRDALQHCLTVQHPNAARTLQQPIAARTS